MWFCSITTSGDWYFPPPPLVMPEWPWHASPEEGAWRLPAKPYMRPMRPTTRSNP